MACALQRPARSPTRCAPAWTAWPQAVAVPVAATARAVVAMVAVVTAPVVVDTAAAVAVPAVAADTVAVAARVAVAAAVTAVKPFRNVEGLSCHLYQPSRARKRPFCFCYSLHSSTRPIHLR